jgi:hypothetical protein
MAKKFEQINIDCKFITLSVEAVSTDRAEKNVGDDQMSPT